MAGGGVGRHNRTTARADTGASSGVVVLHFSRPEPSEPEASSQWLGNMTSYIRYFSGFTFIFVLVLQLTFGNGAGVAEDVKLYFEQAVLIWGLHSSFRASRSILLLCLCINGIDFNQVNGHWSMRNMIPKVQMQTSQNPNKPPTLARIQN